MVWIIVYRYGNRSDRRIGAFVIEEFKSKKIMSYPRCFPQKLLRICATYVFTSLRPRHSDRSMLQGCIRCLGRPLALGLRIERFRGEGCRCTVGLGGIDAQVSALLDHFKLKPHQT